MTTDRILLSWDQFMPDPCVLSRYYQEWEEYLPFDGLILSVNQDRLADIYGSWRGFSSAQSPDPVRTLSSLAFSGVDFRDLFPGDPLDSYRRAIGAMQSCDFRRFKHNFLPVDLFPAQPDVFVDGAGSWLTAGFEWVTQGIRYTGWEATKNNVACLARLARSLGCRGLFFDAELDNNSAMNYAKVIQRLEERGQAAFANIGFVQPTTLGDPDAWEHNRRSFKQKASELARIITDEFPDAVLMFSFGLSTFINQTDLSEIPNGPLHGYALLPQFLDGLVAATGSGTVIVDGCEGNYMWNGNSVIPDDVIGRYAGKAKTDSPFLGLLSLDPKTYSERVSVGLGLMYKGQQSSDPVAFDTLKRQTKSAFRHTDSYVFLFSGDYPPWLIGEEQVETYPWYRWRSRHSRLNDPRNRGWIVEPYSAKHMFGTHERAVELGALYMLAAEREKSMSNSTTVKYRLILEPMPGKPGLLRSQPPVQSIPFFTGQVYLSGPGPEHHAKLDMACDELGRFDNQTRGYFVTGGASSAMGASAIANNLSDLQAGNGLMEQVPQDPQIGQPPCQWRFKNLPQPSATNSAQLILYVTFIGETREG